MNKMKKLVALTAIMSLFGSQIQGQEYNDVPVDDSGAYYDSGRASYLSAALPLGALAVAAIIIATTDQHHHHHHGSNNHNRSHNNHHHGHFNKGNRF